MFLECGNIRQQQEMNMVGKVQGNFLDSVYGCSLWVKVVCGS